MIPDFSWLPPEINSARIFTGPGSTPLLGAAAAWEGLAKDLQASAASFASITSDLAGNSWLGPSSTAMMAVATQYAGVLNATAAQAEAAAAQASATASAFESALAAMVQPAVVAANRGLMQLLAATNWLGQNAPAIADIEAAYEQMWALDVAAMAGYHAGASAAVSLLAPWSQVLQDLGVEGPSGQLSLGLGLGGRSSASTGSANSTVAPTGGSSGGTSGTTSGGNSGANNVGLGNTGNNNIGFGNTGNNDFGIGLTGNNQFGFGGLNSGTGNIGLFNSGTGNIGFFNSGDGNIGIGNTGISNAGLWNSGAVNAGLANAGPLNTGFGNSGIGETGFANQPADLAALSSGRYLTGGLGAGALGSGILNSAAASTAGFNPAVATTNLLNSGMSPAASVVNSFDAGSQNSAASAPQAAPSVKPLANAPAGFFAGSGTSGLRGITVRDPGLGAAAVGDDGIPKSDFFSAANEEGEAPSVGTREPGSAE